jgi:hypothetical protein
LANDDLDILWKMMANGFTDINALEILDELNGEEESGTSVSTMTPASPTPTPTPRP